METFSTTTNTTVDLPWVCIFPVSLYYIHASSHTGTLYQIAGADQYQGMYIITERNECTMLFQNLPIMLKDTFSVYNLEMSVQR